MSDGPITITMTRDELTEIVRTAVRAELDHVGLTVEEADHVTEAREDSLVQLIELVIFDEGAD